MSKCFQETQESQTVRARPTGFLVSRRRFLDSDPSVRPTVLRTSLYVTVSKVTKLDAFVVVFLCY